VRINYIDTTETEAVITAIGNDTSRTRGLFVIGFQYVCNAGSERTNIIVHGGKCRKLMENVGHVLRGDVSELEPQHEPPFVFQALGSSFSLGGDLAKSNGGPRTNEEAVEKESL